MTHPTGDPLIGRTVAHYEIVSRLGGGGMGVVYRANDRKLGRTVAVKFLPPQWSHDEAAKQRFIREAQAASATHHPNICTIHDVETADDGQLFIVMAYYEGPTLKERLQDGPLPVDEALDIATQLADGLAKAHAQGVVHRDIKPGNLILTEDGVRIVDFGLATFADALQLTTEGSTLGTAAYMSPEQSRGEEADARTDVWAAGVVLYEMLAGHVPFRGSHAEAIAYAVRNDPPPPLRPERPEIPEDVEQVVFRALHKDGPIRYQSGRELARALRQIRGLTVPQDLRTQVVLPPTRTRRRVSRRPRIAALVAASTLMAGVPAWFLMPVEGLTLAIAPAVNETGLDALDGAGYALAEELGAALSESPIVRVVEMDRVREIVRADRESGKVVIQRDTMLAINRRSGAQVVLAPRLIAVGEEFRLRVDLIDPRSGTATSTLVAGTPVTSLLDDAAYALVTDVAPLVGAAMAERAGWRAVIGDWLRTRIGNHVRPPRFTSLAAAVAFERGLEAYESLEYRTAAESFAAASAIDAEHPLPHTWRSRALLLMRHDAEAADAARRAQSVASKGSQSERRLIEAVAAEARGDFDTALERYRALAEANPENPDGHMEVGAFLERRGQWADAIAAYRRAVELAGNAVSPRAELELCRLYGPTRQNDVSQAREHADLAMRGYQALRASPDRPYPLEAQVAMCRVDVLWNGTSGDRAQAVREAAFALTMLDSPRTPYQRARALYYRGLAEAGQQRHEQVIAYTEQALHAARQTTNTPLEALARLNLGASSVRLGRLQQAIAHYTASSALFTQLGEEQRAADAQANAGAILVEFGDAESGYRLVDNALKVSSRRGNTRALVFALQATAAYFRNSGRHADADQHLNRAITIAAEQKFSAALPSLIEDRARSLIELGEYATARELVSAATKDLGPRQRAQGEIRLAQIETRLGDFARARARLAEASKAIAADDLTTRVLLEAASGELEYEAGRPGAAVSHFRAAAGSWGAELPHPRAVEALAYTGFLEGRAEDVEKALAQASLTRRLAVETRCRLFLARLAIVHGRHADAGRILQVVPPDGDGRALGDELRAQVHFWTAHALRGDPSGAAREMAAARQLVEELRRRMPAEARDMFARRAEIARILQ